MYSVMSIPFGKKPQDIYGCVFCNKKTAFAVFLLEILYFHQADYRRAFVLVQLHQYIFDCFL